MPSTSAERPAVDIKDPRSGVAGAGVIKTEPKEEERKKRGEVLRCESGSGRLRAEIRINPGSRQSRSHRREPVLGGGGEREPSRRPGSSLPNICMSKVCAGGVIGGDVVDLAAVPCYEGVPFSRSSVMNPDIFVSMCLDGTAPRATIRASLFVGTLAVSRTPRDELRAEKTRCARRDSLVRLNEPK
jgi:hypothetical protein